MDQQSVKICGTLKLIQTMKTGDISKFEWKLRDIRITKIILGPIWATILFRGFTSSKVWVLSRAATLYNASEK